MPSIRRSGRVAPELIISDGNGTALMRVPIAVRQQLQYLCSRLNLHDGRVPASIAVTSAVSGEGVTFISRSLAAVLAEDLGHRTCLVGANWWTEDPPADHNVGLADLIQHEAELDDVLIPTSSPRLSLIESGSVPDPPRSTLAATEALTGVMARLCDRFDHVILDSPATSTSPAAMTFTSAADATLIVARQQMVRPDQVERAAADHAHTRILGVVLNDFHLSMPKALQRRLLDA